jgi:hypothetical protein
LIARKTNSFDGAIANAFVAVFAVVDVQLKILCHLIPSQGAPFVMFARSSRIHVLDETVRTFSFRPEGQPLYDGLFLLPHFGRVLIVQPINTGV